MNSALTSRGDLYALIENLGRGTKGEKKARAEARHLLRMMADEADVKGNWAAVLADLRAIAALARGDERQDVAALNALREAWPWRTEYAEVEVEGRLVFAVCEFRCDGEYRTTAKELCARLLRMVEGLRASDRSPTKCRWCRRWFFVYGRQDKENCSSHCAKEQGERGPEDGLLSGEVVKGALQLAARRLRGD